MSDANTEPEPWKACYQQLASKLLLFARQWVTSPADAEDVVQTAFIRFWQKNPEAQPEHYPLLFATVRTTALDLIRSDGRRALRENAYYNTEFDAAFAFFDSSLEQREDAQAVERALRQLPTEQREVVALRIWGELTFSQISTALGESINTVSSRYRYGLDTLRNTLSSHHHERV
jgi:RNA polymerase sigma-70 factor (ECF subfamily)